MEYRVITSLSAYCINRFGTVRSIRNGKIIKPYLHHAARSSYLRVQLGRGNKHYVHRLVFLTFTGEILNSNQIDHKDGNTFNNWITNLQSIPRELNASKKLNKFKHGV